MAAIHRLALRLFVHVAANASPPRSSLREGDRGTVLVEYTAVFAFVSIGLAIAIVALGPLLLKAWGTTQHVILAAKP